MTNHPVCGEIEYPGVHSDVCPSSLADMATIEYREFIHNVLDEWLDRSNGSGFFYIGNIDALRQNFKE